MAFDEDPGIESDKGPMLFGCVGVVVVVAALPLLLTSPGVLVAILVSLLLTPLAYRAVAAPYRGAVLMVTGLVLVILVAYGWSGVPSGFNVH